MRQRLAQPIFLIELVIGLVLLIAAAAGALVWRISDSPLALDRLIPLVQQALEDRFPGVSASIDGGVFLAWDAPEHALTLVARDLSISAGAGAPFKIPELALNFDRMRLLGGALLPKSITVQRPRFDIERSVEGGWRVAGFARTQGASQLSEERDWLSDALSSEGAVRDMSAGFDRLGVRGASIVVRDLGSGLSAEMEGVDLTVRKTDGAWSIALVGRATARTLSLAFEGAATLGPQGWSVMGKADMGSAELAMIRGMVEAASLPLPPPMTLAEGRVAATLTGRAEWPGGAMQDIRVIEATAKARVESLSMAQEPLSGVSGRADSVDLTLVWSGPEERLSGSLRIDAANVAHAAIPAGAVDLKSVEMSAIYNRRDDSLSDARLSIDSAFTTASAVVSIAGVSGPMTTTMEARATGVSVDDLRKYWPTPVAPNPRKWLLTNVSRGAVNGVAVNAVFSRGGPDGVEFHSLGGTMDASGMRIQYVPRMPVVEQAAGSAVFDLKRFDITLASGVVLRQRLQRGKIDITGLHLKDQDIAFDLTMAGPLASALDILDSPPLGYVKRFGLPVNEVGGDVTTRLLIRFPLLNRLTFDDVKISANADAAGVRFARLVRGLDVTDGTLQVKVDQDSLSLNGRASLLGQPFAIEWSESFARAPLQRRSLTVSGDADGALRAALGLNAESLLQGSMAVKLAYVAQDARRARLSAVIDLRRSSISIEQLGYVKPSGGAAELRVDLSLLSGVAQTADLIRYSADGASASGRGRFSDGGDLIRVDLDRLRVGETDLAVSYMHAAGGAQISAIGARLDLRPVLKDKPDHPPEPNRPVRIDLNVASVRLSDEVQFSNVRGRLQHDGLKTVSADVEARAAGGLLRAILKPGQGGRDLLVTGDDAGTLMQALGVSQSMRGGKLRLSGWFDDRLVDSPLQGRLEIGDSRVVGAPILSRLLQLTSVTGIPELLSGEGVAFQTIVADFTMLNDIIDLKELRASGLALGVLLRGRADRGKETLDMTGTLVPIYGFNRVLGAIPLLGDILTGGGGGGLFAFTFAVRGASASPDVSVNPLSVLAPGLLRRLFEYEQQGDAPARPARPPPATSNDPGGGR